MSDTATATSRRLFHRVGDIEPTPPRHLIRGLLELDSVAVFFGESASLKSFLAISLSAAVATHRPFYGFEVREHGTVLYVAGEGQNGLRRRFRAWEIDSDFHLQDAPLYVSSRAVPFGDEAALSTVLPEADAITELDGPPRLIVVDTLSRNLAGDENSSYDMPAFISAVDKLRERYGSTILVVHHTGHGDKQRSRGHSSLKPALDFEYRFDREANGGPVRVTCTKSKDSAPPEPMQFRARGVELFDVLDEDGNAVTSAVLDREEYTEPEQPRQHRGKWKDHAVSVLQKLEAEKAEGLGVLFETWKRTCQEEMSRQRFSEVSKKLQEEGRVKREEAFVTLL